MKRKFKVLGSVLAGLLVVSLVFGAGVYASQWLNFTGDKQIEQSESDVDEIMQILRDTHAGKLSAESALAELKELNPRGLVKKIEKLEKDLEERDETIGVKNGEIERLEGEKAILATDLAAANKEKTDAENALAGKQEELNNKNQELLNKQAEIEAKQQEIQEKIEEGNRKVAEKQAELDGVAQQRDEHKRVAEELQQQINQNSEYVKHLERELQRANEAVVEYGQTTQEAVEEARTYK